ncbi:thymidylate synthase [Herbiconiux sp. P18]|uniref:thymidylate synthase n=1 Tax=Herbiconiux liangxiaofengii TaxID=3342795 RepID=UPI0035B71DE9
MTRYRNIEEAFIGELQEVIANGDDIEVRNSKTREVRARLIELDAVRERCVLLPGRHNNIFASIAESMWVLCGRDDLEYLCAYLPRAKDFSDDGVTWRAAYGPRLRNWNGVDQLAEIINILRSDPNSRRAVAALFDPDRDFVQSKDIPCNNWLHFLVRGGQLDLHVVARSTDIWWGFSGINAFEWSLLLELMSCWLELSPGRLTFFTSSLHLYERHAARAEAVLSDIPMNREALYSSNRTETAQFVTPWETSAEALGEWMNLEARMRAGIDLDDLETDLTDPLLTAYAQMIDVFWNFKRGSAQETMNLKIERLGDLDLRHAATEFLERQHSDRH